MEDVRRSIIGRARNETEEGMDRLEARKKRSVAFWNSTLNVFIVVTNARIHGSWMCAMLLGLKGQRDKQMH